MVNRRSAYALAIRGALVVFALLSGACVGLGWQAVSLIAATTWALSGWVTPLAWSVAIAAGAIAAVDVRVSVIAGLVAAAVAALCCRRILALAETGFRVYSGSSSNPLGFLGRGFLLRALWSRSAASLIVAVDKVTHDDQARARPFVEDCDDAIPVAWTAVVRQCEALMASADRRLQEALVLTQSASELAATAPAAIRGWCALQCGDILLAAGNRDAAEAKWGEAAEQLTASRVRFWRVQADLRRAQALTEDAENVERVVGGLEIICRLRVLAVRRIDFGLLQRTEYLVLRLMHAVGNSEGVRRYLAGTAMSQLKNDKVMIGTSVSEHAANLLLKASVAMDRIDEAPVVAARAALQEEAVEAIGAALRHLSRTRRPLLTATAYAAMARVQALSNCPEAALANALESLYAVQYVRYQLPTTSWRASWVRAHRHVYTMALDLAADDPGLTGELLEVVRAQAVPLERDEPAAWTRSILDALVAEVALPQQHTPKPLGNDRTATTEDADRILASADPLVAGQTVLIQHASWLGGDADHVIDVDDELTMMFPGAWYWSLGHTGSRIHHAIRTPDGDWLSERQTYAEIAPALENLLRHLPVNLPSETAKERKKRLQASVLLRESAQQAGFDGKPVGEVWTQICDRLGLSLIPEPLRRALAEATDRPLRLVIAPTGTFTSLPFAALSAAPGVPMVERAVLAHLPSVALLAARRRSHQQDASAAISPRSPQPQVLAVLAPHLNDRVDDPDDVDDKVDLRHALGSGPPSAETTRGRMTKSEFAAAIAHRSAPDTVLYLAGHVDVPAVDEPTGTGFRFHDGRLTLRDFYELDRDGQPVYQMPHRVLLSGCESMGVYTDTAMPQDHVFTAEPEWLGLGAAMVYGGARNVYCSLFRVLDCPYIVRVDLALIDALRQRTDPAQALRATQLAEIQRWRGGSGALPIVFLAYVYVGFTATL